MNIFLDANIIIDLIDLDRGKCEQTKKQLGKYIINEDTLYTSCDIFTTVYYVASKKVQYEILMNELEKILTFINIIPIDIDIINIAMTLSKDEKQKDLEDILQYTCAKNMQCELIVTNDKKFYTKDIKIESI